MVETRSPAVPEERARDLLLVRAFEEADLEGVLLERSERERATAEALDGANADAQGLEFAGRRAERLLEHLRARVRGLDALASVAGADLSARWLVPLALVLGALGNALGDAGVVNVLAFPLLGAIAWNLAVYVGLLVTALRGGAPDRTRRGLAPRIAELGLGRRLRGALAHGSSDARGALAARAATSFGAHWVESARPLIVARAVRALHLAAAAFVAGAVLGMYLRGLGFEYRAQWGSTFLSPQTVDRLFALLFAPARALAGLELPGAESLRTPATGPAAPWIHAWALTALVFVVLPRLALWALASARVRRLAGALPIQVEAPYWRRLRAAAASPGERVLLLALGGALAPAASQRLRGLLHELCGARAEFEKTLELGYGAEASELSLAEGSLCVAALFDLAQPPELEVHGRFLSELRERLAGRSDAGRLLVVVDGAAFAARQSGEVGARRLRERRAAWDKVASDAGLSALHVDLSQPAEEDEFTRAEAALWSEEHAR